MKIYNIYGTQNVNNSTFGRKPDAKEMQIYTNSVNEGLRLLNKQLDIIIHNSAAPAIEKENTGIGSLFSRTVQTKLIPFLKEHGFIGIQQEPNNLRKADVASPYDPESSAKNIYMIPLEKLTTEQYGKILSEYDIEKVVKNRSKSNRVDYYNVSEEYNKVLNIAYQNFKNKSVMENEFQAFKDKKSGDLEKDALFHILCKHYNVNWNDATKQDMLANWNDVDRFLFCPRTPEEANLAKERIIELKKLYTKEIDFFLFKQFLIEIANTESNNLTKQTGVKIIGDSPVATPAADIWKNQDLFMKGKALGCPPDYFSPNGQRWGFKYFNPKYIFNPDGTLGKAGKLMKGKYDAFFESFPGGIRIDHTIGLVDPFIYTVDSKTMTKENSGRIYSVEGEFKKKKEEYSNILEKIVLQSAKEHGMDKSSIICEDLGDPNKPTIDVMKKLDLSGIAVTQFDYRGKTTPERNVIMIGSHDNPSFLEYIDNLFSKVEGKNINERTSLTRMINRVKNYIRNRFNLPNKDWDLIHFMTKTKLLAQDTAPKDATKQEIKKYKQELRTDKNKFFAASFAELFTSPAKRIQIFFADFWGLGKTYNTPGTDTGNWELRIPSEFEKRYYKAVSEGKAPNLANAIATALRQRGLDKTNPELVKNLDDSAKILSES